MTRSCVGCIDRWWQGFQDSLISSTHQSPSTATPLTCKYLQHQDIQQRHGNGKTHGKTSQHQDPQVLQDTRLDHKINQGGNMQDDRRTVGNLPFSSQGTARSTTMNSKNKTQPPQDGHDNNTPQLQGPSTSTTPPEQPSSPSRRNI